MGSDLYFFTKMNLSEFALCCARVQERPSVCASVCASVLVLAGLRLFNKSRNTLMNPESSAGDYDWGA